MIHRSLILLFFYSIINISPAQHFNCNDEWFEGEGTYYDGIAGGEGGNCSLPVATGDFRHAAINNVQYDNSSTCGSCVRVLGPRGEITLKIVDRCPECKIGDIDMTTDAFLQLADLKDGRIPIRWQFVPCEVEGNIQIVYDLGMGPYYFKAQLRNMNYAVNELSYKNSDGEYVPIERAQYNYFVALGGIDENKQQAGPYQFRITSITGQTIEIPSVPFVDGGIVSLETQFTPIDCPDCAGIIGGSAQIDQCGKCAGGTTNILPNSLCKQDCIGYWNGTSYLDTCGICVSGTTGNTPCGQDCNGDNGGLAFIDLCGICAGGNSGITPITNPDECLTLQTNNYTEKNFSMFPNPFEDILTLRYHGEFTYSFYNSLGSVVEHGSGIDEIQLITTFPIGTYILQVNTKEQVQKHLVVKH